MAVGIRPNVALAQDRRARRSTAASWSTTTWSPRDPDDLRGRRMRRASRPVLRPGRADLGDVPRAGRRADRRADAAMRARSPRPSSRSRASTCSRPATSPGGDGAEDIVLRDAARGVYKRVVVEDDRIVGAVLYGDTADGDWYFDLLQEAGGRRRHPRRLIFGQAFATEGRRRTLAPPLRRSRTMRRSAAATASARARSSRRIAGGRLHASTRCARSCKASASLRLLHRAGREPARADARRRVSSERAAKTMCKCTSFGHDDVRRRSSRRR